MIKKDHKRLLHDYNFELGVKDQIFSYDHAPNSTMSGMIWMIGLKI